MKSKIILRGHKKDFSNVAKPCHFLLLCSAVLLWKNCKGKCLTILNGYFLFFFFSLRKKISERLFTVLAQHKNYFEPIMNLRVPAQWNTKGKVAGTGHSKVRGSKETFLQYFTLVFITLNKGEFGPLMDFGAYCWMESKR